MHLKNYLLLALALYSCNIVNSQDKNFDFGKVPAQDIFMETYDPEPDAEAVVLGHTLGLTLNLRNTTEMYYSYHKRIKIFDESAFDLGNVVLAYYAEDGIENIKRLKAIITYPDGTSYKLQKSEFYKDEIDDKYKTITFTYPKLEEGAIIEYQYELISENVTLVKDFIYQEKYPVRYSHLELDIPGIVDYIFINKGDPGLIDQRGTFLVMDSIPSMKQESYVTTMDDYRGTIKMQIRGFQSPTQGYIPMLDTWPNVMEDLIESKSFGNQYIKNFSSSKMVKEVKKTVGEDLRGKDLFQALQDALLDKVTCNYEGWIYSTEGIGNAWKEGDASRTELNFMMIVLLRAYGYEAYPMLVSQRSHGNVLTEYPFLNQFSYALVYTELEGKPFLMDISDKHRPPGMVSFEALNGEGLVVRAETGGWAVITPSKGLDAFYFQTKIENDELTGTMQGKYVSYNALPERRLYEDDKEGKHWEGRIHSKFPDAEITNISYDEGGSLYTPIKDKFDITIPGACVVSDDLIYVDPFIYSNYTENPFKLNERNFPVDFGNPRGEHYVFMLDIPEGYVIEELPESINLASEDRKAIYQFNTKMVGEKIMITRKIEFRKPIYHPEEYAVLKKIFDLLLEKDGEQIVLKKS